MFYSQVIFSKKGPLGKVWMAAHWMKKMSKSQIIHTSVSKSADSILNPDVPMALRLTGHLLLGLVRIYCRQVSYLYTDCSDVFTKINRAFQSGEVDMAGGDDTAPRHAIDIPVYAQNFAFDFGGDDPLPDDVFDDPMGADEFVRVAHDQDIALHDDGPVLLETAEEDQVGEGFELEIAREGQATPLGASRQSMGLGLQSFDDSNGGNLLDDSRIGDVNDIDDGFQDGGLGGGLDAAAGAGAEFDHQIDEDWGMEPQFERPEYDDYEPEPEPPLAAKATAEDLAAEEEKDSSEDEAVAKQRKAKQDARKRRRAELLVDESTMMSADEVKAMVANPAGTLRPRCHLAQACARISRGLEAPITTKTLAERFDTPAYGDDMGSELLHVFSTTFTAGPLPFPLLPRAGDDTTTGTAAYGTYDTSIADAGLDQFDPEPRDYDRPEFDDDFEIRGPDEDYAPPPVHEDAGVEHAVEFRAGDKSRLDEDAPIPEPTTEAAPDKLDASTEQAVRALRSEMGDHTRMYFSDMTQDYDRLSAARSFFGLLELASVDGITVEQDRSDSSTFADILVTKTTRFDDLSAQVM